MGEPGLQQRLKDAGDWETDLISKAQFVDFLKKLGTTPIDILALQRVVGFIGDIQKLKVSDIMIKIMERANKRGQIE